MEKISDKESNANVVVIKYVKMKIWVTEIVIKRQIDRELDLAEC